MSPKSNPQLGPVTALFQLLTEHPELPHLFWTLNPDGWLSGSLHFDATDPKAVVTAYACVLGGKVDEAVRDVEDEGGTRRYSVTLHATWRDVPFYIGSGCDIPASVAKAVAA